MTFGLVAVGVGTLGAAAMGSSAARDAASTSAAAADRAAGMTQAQYDQTRADLSPYRRVATGRETDVTFNEDEFNTARAQYDQDVADIKGSFGQSNVAYRQEQAAIAALGGRPTRQDFTSQNFEGGSLNTLADYGRSQVNPGDYIPRSDVPQYDNYFNNLPQINSDIPQFNVDSTIPAWSSRGDIPDFSVQGSQPEFGVGSNIPTFDVQGNQPGYNQLTDITQDPSYQIRKQEQDRSINRNMASMGKIMSGNRLEELMSRSGDLASQEYAAADARNVRDYDINREREMTGYGRDLTTYGENRLNEATQYGRGVSEYDIARQAEQEGYGRDLTGYDMARQNESTGYGRDRSIYDTGYQREGDIYSRGLTAYDASRQNEMAKYGRDVDAYGRDYSLNTDRYNADTGRENLMYARGVDDYSRAYGQEGEYLNRLANLSNIGQTATNTGATFGANAALTGGSFIQNSGNAQAAGQIGNASAWQGAMGDLTSLGTAYAMRQPQSSSPTWTTDYNPVNTPYMPARYN